MKVFVDVKIENFIFYMNLKIEKTHSTPPPF